jgi:hypothetical protein
MYLSAEQVAVTNSAKDVSDLTIPGNATHAELQATTSSVPVRYTMDDSTTPTVSVGMLLLAEGEPKTFLVEDIRRIKFIRGAGSDGTLDIHYFGGRDV